MLDLDAAVQLEEEELVAVEDELDRAGAAVADRLAERDGRVVQRRPQRGGEAGCGRLLEHLLVAPLDGAVALADRDDAPVRVGEELHLDVARSLEVALAVERAVAERALGLALGRLERVVELVRRANDAHAATAAARRRLDEQREADLLAACRPAGRERRPRARSASRRACLRRAAAPPATGRPR